MTTIPSNLAAFQTVWAMDTEFVIEAGEPFDPVMLAVQNVMTGQTHVYRRDAMLRWTQLPFRNDRQTLLVCFNASAEAGFLQALGLETDAWWLCLMAESRLERNFCIPRKQLRKFAATHPTLYRPNENITLIEAAAQVGLSGGDADYKALSRELVLSRQWETGEEGVWQAIATYCLSDVRLTAELFRRMEPTINFSAALIRGAYAAEHGRMGARGIPFDVATVARLKHHHALMYLACWYWEYWLSLPLPTNPLAWPARCLEEVWHWLTPEYCLTAFDYPMTREEALDLCVKEVKEVHEKYSYLQEGLAEELCARLTWSGAEVTAYLNEWRDATEFYDRQDAAAEAGVAEPCGHSPRSLRWCADGQHECRQCEFEVERQGWYEEDRQRAAAGERLDCGHVPTDQVYGDDGGYWCRVCRPHGYEED